MGILNFCCSMQEMLVSIVIPVFNSSETIRNVVCDCIAKFCGIYELEVILVNDCSTDKSHDVCKSLCDDFSETVKYLKLAKNFGEHNAVMAGLNFAKGDYIITMDDDGQNPPSEALKLVLKAVDSKADVVFSKYSSKKHSPVRNFMSKINDMVASVMLKKPRGLYLSSFRVISKKVVHEVIKYDLPFPYIDGLILRASSNIATELSIHEPRAHGKSGYTLRKLLKLWLNMFTSFSILPLRIATVVGMLFSVFGFAFGIFTIFERILNPNLPVGWATIAVLISFLGGVQLVALGVVGEYLGRIFLGANKQPQFIIEQQRNVEHRKL
jgi:glycosyltransferase involved in cell wall biosynthesis